MKRVRLQQVYTGSKDETVRVWDIATGKCTSVVQVGGHVDSLKMESGYLFVGMHITTTPDQPGLIKVRLSHGMCPQHGGLGCRSMEGSIKQQPAACVEDFNPQQSLCMGSRQCSSTGRWRRPQAKLGQAFQCGRLSQSSQFLRAVVPPGNLPYSGNRDAILRTSTVRDAGVEHADGAAA